MSADESEGRGVGLSEDMSASFVGVVIVNYVF